MTWEEVIAVKNKDFTNQTNNFRQDLCTRYALVQNGTIQLRDALQGLSLRPLMRVSKFFPYTPEGGIDPLDPGLLALMMDELGRRAGFSWRNSFGVLYGLPEKPESAPDDETIAFTDVLNWSIENYDLSCNWWDQTLERLELGIRFMQPWFDGSIIMIRKKFIPEVDDGTVEVWNWLRPFSFEVWIVTIATIFFSGFAYMWLEHLSGHRRHREFWQWFSDNVYLSAISFPQNYEFQPRSAAARLFGVSISLWALVMTATYTANLASLLVDTKEPRLVVEEIDDAITLGIPVCVYEGTGADAFIKQKYKQARRVPLKSEFETYEGLNKGLCELNLAYYQNWLGFESQKAYNPYCDLEWAGRKIKVIESGFANNADVGLKCTGLVGNVLDIYFNELLESGFIEDMWERHYDLTRDINCDAVSPQLLDVANQDGETRRRRFLNAMETRKYHPEHRNHRKLKPGQRGGAAGAAALVDGAVEASQMTLNQMAGTFILHYWVTGLAIVIGYAARFMRNREKPEMEMTERSNKFANRRWLSTRFGDTISTRWDGVRGSTSFGRKSTASSLAALEEENSEEDSEYEERGLSSIREELRAEEQSPKGLQTSSWQAAQREIRETKQELKETKAELQLTRKEMKEQMDKMMCLLHNMKSNMNINQRQSTAPPPNTNMAKRSGSGASLSSLSTVGANGVAATNTNQRQPLVKKPSGSGASLSSLSTIGANGATAAAAPGANATFGNGNEPSEISVLPDGTKVQYVFRDGKKYKRTIRTVRAPVPETGGKAAPAANKPRTTTATIIGNGIAAPPAPKASPEEPANPGSQRSQSSQFENEYETE